MKNDKLIGGESIVSPCFERKSGLQSDTRHSLEYPGSRRKWQRVLIFAAWAIIASVVSQIPYLSVWTSDVGIPYDASTSFTPIYAAQVSAIQSGRAVFQYRHEQLPGVVMPAYALAGPLRQLSLMWDGYNAAWHAKIQAIHVGLTASACGFLLFSFGMPIWAAMAGGVVFVSAGINSSLAQHTAAQEALLYLTLSLLFIRITVKQWGKHPSPKARLQGAVLFSATAVSLSALTDWYHEAVHYFLPLAGWTVGHVWARTRELGWRGSRHIAGYFVLMAAVVFLLSLPTLLAAYEMTFINKTLIADYWQGARYPSQLFWAGLLFPDATFATDVADIGTHFGDRTTLFIYAGAGCAFIILVVLNILWQRDARVEAVVIATLALLFLGFSLGVGSSVHWLLSGLFPPFGMMRHHFYGLKLFYLLLAYCLARLLTLMTQQSIRTSTTLLVSLFVGSLAALFYAEWVVRCWPNEFVGKARSVLADNLQRFAFINILLATLIGCTKVGKAPMLRIAVIGVALIPVVDLLESVTGQHFVPPQIMRHTDEPSVSTSVADGLVEAVRNERDNFEYRRRLRVLPIDIGWWGNLLYSENVAVLSSSDSQGIQKLEDAVKSVSDHETAEHLAAELGTDLIWTNNASWKQWLSQSKYFQEIASSPYLGGLFKFSANEYFSASGNRPTVWYDLNLSVLKEEGWWATRWTASELPRTGAVNIKEAAGLPLMWLSLFDAYSSSGEKLALSSNAYGVLTVAIGKEPITLYYPKKFIVPFLWAGTLLYALIILALVVASALYLILLIRQPVNSLVRVR